MIEHSDPRLDLKQFDTTYTMLESQLLSFIDSQIQQWQQSNRSISEKDVYQIALTYVGIIFSKQETFFFHAISEAVADKKITEDDVTVLSDSLNQLKDKYAQRLTEPFLSSDQE